MKVVIAHRTGQARVVDLPEPTGGKNFVTVRVSHSAMVLPNELQMIEEANRRTKKGDDGFPLGSCASGTILDSGKDVQRLKTGLRVAVTGPPYVYHGGQLVVPEHLAVELPKKVSHEEGAYAGLGAAALHLVRVSGVQIGETALIFGGDMLGILAAQIVRAAGANPILVDESDFRRTKASAVGIAHTHAPEDQDLVEAINSSTDGVGADVALMTRANDPLSYPVATQLLREAAVLVIGRPVGHDISVDLFRSKNLQVRTATGAGPGLGDPDYEIRGAGYPRALTRWTVRDNMECFCNLMADRRVQVSPLITDRIPLERATTAYEKANRGRDAALGMILTV